MAHTWAPGGWIQWGIWHFWAGHGGWIVMSMSCLQVGADMGWISGMEGVGPQLGNVKACHIWAGGGVFVCFWAGLFVWAVLRGAGDISRFHFAADRTNDKTMNRTLSHTASLANVFSARWRSQGCFRQSFAGGGTQFGNSWAWGANGWKWCCAAVKYGGLYRNW